MADNSTNEQTQNSERRSAEEVADENRVSSAILVRAYKSIADRSKLLEGLARLRKALVGVVKQIDELKQDIEQN